MEPARSPAMEAGSWLEHDVATMTLKGLQILGLLALAASSLRAEDDSLVAPRCVVSLNGTWQCEAGGTDTKPLQWRRAVPVPGLVDLCDPALKWEDHEYFWYRKSFQLPSGHNWTRAVVRIEQSQFGSQVWLNGQLLGQYDGCYTAHEYEAGHALARDGENELIVRVGQKRTLPPGSAVGLDTEKRSYIPGIWGDVALILAGDPMIRAVFVTPHLDSQTAECRIELENLASKEGAFTLSAVVREKSSGSPASDLVSTAANVPAGMRQTVSLNVPVRHMRAWSPDDPFLYELAVSVESGGQTTDQHRCTFGMREFSIRDSDFYLNGKRMFLRGGNIAFHRFLSDPARGTLPWDTNWIRKVMGEIPRANHFNYFRVHMGHAYNRWYDLADEFGLCIQDEWMFWGKIAADPDQIRQEFTAWIRDNYNHPSIIIWDPINEVETNAEAQAKIRTIKEAVVPAMKRIDPTRPWESVDFEEDHPYIYSLGPVLNDESFGFARAIADIEAGATPSVLNEFPWFWLDGEGKPPWGTQEVMLRWLGRNGTRDELLAFQSFLATELVEQFRRMRVDAIAPFVYLGDGLSFTAHWFLGNIREAKPKPILAALKNAFAPRGVSLELWDRHFFTNETRVIDACVFNDTPSPAKVRLRCRIRGDEADLDLCSLDLNLDASSMTRVPVTWVFPPQPGSYTLRVDLEEEAGGHPLAFIEKVAHVFAQPSVPGELRRVRVAVLDSDPEMLTYLRAVGVDAQPLSGTSLAETDVLILEDVHTAMPAGLGDWLKRGGSLVVIDPSRGVAKEASLHIADDISLSVRKRPNTGRGGYDSYVFPVDAGDPLWHGLEPEHLRILNGGFGGIMVADYAVFLDVPCFTRARCGLGLRHAAVVQAPFGNGKIMVSLIRQRGRLGTAQAGRELYDPRPDPVARQYLLNLLSDAARSGPTPKELFIGRVSASSGKDGEHPPAHAVDGNDRTRWASDSSDPQWLVLDLGRTQVLTGARILWEAAYGNEYKLLVSDDATHWLTVYHEKKGDGGEDLATWNPVEARYLALVGLERGTEWGYSVWELTPQLLEPGKPTD